MNLRQATLFALIGIWIYLGLAVFQWVISVFNLIPYLEYRWVFNGFWLLDIVLTSVPIIVFFTVFNSKQKGDLNV